MSTAATKYAKLREQIETAKKAMKDTAAKLFKEMSSELFEENPTLVSFGWTQYTPYWNDGDVCTFSAHTDYPTVTIDAKDGKTVTYDENYGEYKIGDEEATSEDVSAYEKQIEAASKKVSKFLSVFESEDLETMFGDHMQITVTRGGKVETEEYEHD